MALSMGVQMTNAHTFTTSMEPEREATAPDMTTQMDSVESWAPRAAPLEMPCQDIRPRARIFEYRNLLRLILPGQRI